MSIEDWPKGVLRNFIIKSQNESPTPRAEITDLDEIEKLVAKAKKTFTTYLHTKNAQIARENVYFKLTFDIMADSLGLSNLPSDILKDKMDEVVLSVHGMAKIPTGYEVADTDLIYENFGPKSTIIKILKFLSDNPDKSYTHQEIADAVSLNKVSISRFIPGLLSEEKVAVGKDGKVRLG